MRKNVLCLVIVAVLMLCFTVSAEENVETEFKIGDYFSKRDLSGEWEEKKAVELLLTESVTISKGGVYILSGTLDDGTVTVDVGKEEKVQLVLNNVSITSSSSATILVETADKVFITLPEGTENILTSGAFDESSDVDGAVFARDDVVFNGKGSLTVVSGGHGIVCKDDLKIAGGTYHITAGKRGISANDSVRIADGNFTVVSDNDAIRAKNEKDAEKGYVIIFGGTFDLTAGGGADNGRVHMDDFGGGSPGSQGNAAQETSDSKGLQGTGSIILAGGMISINAADDAIHSDTKVRILDGTDLTIASGDDGIHSDSVLMIDGGEVRVIRSYEGLEAAEITLNGGNVSVTASDDGLNSSGGNDGSGNGWNDMFANDGSSITINGGSLYVNSVGDGIDSNGNLIINGGTVVVSGPVESMNGALDANGSMTVNGGTVIAAGSTGMAETFGTSSTQVSFLQALKGAENSTITVADENGSILLSGTVEKSFACVVVSSPDLKVGETYTVSSGSASVSVKINSTSGGRDDGSGGSPGGGGRR